MTNKVKQENYKVWIEQVNQTCIEVKAINEEDAKNKAYRKWRKDEANSIVLCLEKQ